MSLGYPTVPQEDTCPCRVVMLCATRLGSQYFLVLYITWQNNAKSSDVRYG